MPLVANGSGEITGSFVIPAGISVGTKRISAVGGSGAIARASYTGRGVVETTVLQRVFTTRIWNQRDFGRDVDPDIDDDDEDDDDDGGDDPLAQTFTLPTTGRHVTGIDVKFCNIGNVGNPVFCQIREVNLGIPTRIVIAEAFIDMNAVTLNAWHSVDFRAPVYLQANVEYAFVFMTDDENHSLAVATLGEFDAAKQQWVTAQPYSVGVLLSSSNNSTWTPHNESDLAFKVRAATFAPTTKVVDAGDVSLVGVTDIIVFAGVELPAVDTAISVVITRADDSEITLLPGQPYAFDEAVTETVNIRFELSGSDVHSPVLFPFIQCLKGVQAGTGDYVGRAMAAGADSHINVTFDCFIPGASSIVVEIGQEGSWSVMTLDSATPLGDGYQERTYKLTGYALADARVKLTLNGSPADRPLVRNLRAVVTDDPVNIINP